MGNLEKYAAKIGLVIIRKHGPQLMAAIGGGLKAVITAVTPYVLEVVGSLGPFAIAIAPFAIPLLITAVAVFVIDNLS